MNSLYQSMNQNSVQNQYEQFKQNPVQFLMNRNIQLPPQFQNDPKGAVQYLMNNGLMSQGQFNRLSAMAQAMGIKLN